MFTVRLEEQLIDRFAELFAETMPPDADAIYAELGLTAGQAARLPLEIGDLRQIVEAGEVAGYVWIELRDETLHVHALLLEPDFRGRGLGAQVLAELEDEFRDRIVAIELGVEPANERALALYEQAGFERVDERLGFLIMRKQLP